jgi:DNA-binding transcriptional LysR family regulator
MANIDLVHLAAFVAAYDHASMAGVATELAIPASTLSTRLAALEAGLGVKLFGRRGRQLVPLASAGWLYGHSVRLLLLEEYMRLHLARTSGEANSITVVLDSALAGTTLARCVIEAARAVQSSRHASFVDLMFIARGRQVQRLGARASLDLDGKEIEIKVRTGRGKTKGYRRLFEDSWVTVGHQGASASRQTSLALPELPAALFYDAKRQLNQSPWSGEVSAITADLQDHVGLRQALATHRLLLPRALVPERLRSLEHEEVLLSGGPDVGVYVRNPPSLANWEIFEAELIRRLQTRPSRPDTPFKPHLAVASLRAFNSVLTTGSMAETARLLNVSPPRIQARIAQIEAEVTTPLTTKTRDGTRATLAGAAVQPLSAAIAAGFSEITARSAKIAAEFEQSLRIGLPPSWGSDSLTAERMAVALGMFHAEYPRCQIDVIEGTRDALHAGIITGRLNLAVVGKVGLQVGRIALGESEDIMLIVNKEIGFTPRASKVSADELQSVPLILAPTQITMHQTLMSALARSSIRLEPVMRLGSIPLIVAVVRRSPLGTILPASVVRNELNEGIVEAFSLTHFVPRRRLWAIFSTEHMLTDLERRFIAHVRHAFALAA